VAGLNKTLMVVEMEHGFLSLSLTCLGAMRPADIHRSRRMCEVIALR